MNETLKGKKIAILATNGVEQSELEEPCTALIEAGACAELVSPEDDSIWAWHDDKIGDTFDVDVKLKNAKAANYDALVLPGGVMNPDHLRMQPNAVQFVRSFFKAGKPVAAICHGPQILIEVDVLRGRTLTSFSSIKTDLKNAGAHWVNKKVVVDRGLITSRTPDDLPDFNRNMIAEFAKENKKVKKVKTIKSKKLKRPAKKKR